MKRIILSALLAASASVFATSAAAGGFVFPQIDPARVEASLTLRNELEIPYCTGLNSHIRGERFTSHAS